MVFVDTAPKTIPKFTQWQDLLALVNDTAISSTTTAKWRPWQCLAESRGQGLKTPKIRRHSGLDSRSPSRHCAAGQAMSSNICCGTRYPAPWTRPQGPPLNVIRTPSSERLRTSSISRAWRWWKAGRTKKDTHQQTGSVLAKPRSRRFSCRPPTNTGCCKRPMRPRRVPNGTPKIATPH